MSIANISDFITQVKNLTEKDGFENYFRGHPDNAFELQPSIYRDGYIQNEDRIFKETIIRSPQEFTHHKSAVEHLVKMAHYSVPTRLLDITSNPLVALYFACNKDETKDGEVIFFQIPNSFVKLYDSDTVSVLSNIAKRPVNFEFLYIPGVPIPEFNESSHIQFLLHEIKEEKPYFQEIINPLHLEQVYAVKVKLDNPRILKQSGAFLIFGVQSNKTIQAVVPWSWVKEKLIIPLAIKKQLLDDLNILGINYSTLFPELENQALYIKETFKNKKTVC